MNDCCTDAENRGPVEHLTDDLTVSRCLVCGAAHYELDIDEEALVMEADL